MCCICVSTKVRVIEKQLGAMAFQQPKGIVDLQIVGPHKRPQTTKAYIS